MFEYQIKPGQALKAVLIGVVNFGRSDCSTNQVVPTAVANVGFYRNWIEQKIHL